MSDTFDEISCPACHKPMKKIYLVNQKFNVDICLEGCGGLFLDYRGLIKKYGNMGDKKLSFEKL